MLGRLIAALLIVSGLTACTATAPTVDVDPNRGVRPVAVRTYSLVVENMPGFLVPIMREELVGALAAQGAVEVAGGGDVEFRLTFEQVTLLAGDIPSSVKFEGVTAPEEATRFIARAELTARVMDSATVIRVGSLSRVHTVSAGVYMHPRSRQAIRRGFEQLLGPFLAPGAAVAP